MCVRLVQEAQDIFGDVTELLEMYEARKAAGASARCEVLALLRTFAPILCSVCCESRL